jgi:hypothetical protein
MFFTTPESIDTFFKHIHKGKKGLEKAYKKAELIKIAANLGVSNLVGTKSQLVDRISSRIGPGTELSLRNDILDQYNAKQAKNKTVKKSSKKSSKKGSPLSTGKTYTKPYDQCSIEELREEADSEGLFSTGSRRHIVERLERLDSGKGTFDDCTDEKIREELQKNGFLSTGSREILLARVKRCDDNFNGPVEDRTGEWLKDYLSTNARLTTGSRDELVGRAKRVSGHALADYDDEYLKEGLVESNLPVTGARKDWLLAMYPIEIDVLQRAVKGLELQRANKIFDKQLQKKPSVVYKNSHKKSSGPTMLGSMVRGAAWGAGLSLGARILSGRRRLHERTTLKF